MEDFVRFMEMITLALSIVSFLILMLYRLLENGGNQDEEWACYKTILFYAALATTGSWLIWGAVAFRDLELRDGIFVIALIGGSVTGLISVKSFIELNRYEINKPSD